MDAGFDMGKLTSLAREVNNVALTRRMFLGLEKEKVGTNKIEIEAFKTLMEMRKEQKEGVKKPTTCNIKEFRDANKVLDLLRLKLKYVEKEEKEARKAYRREKRELQRNLGENEERLLRRKIQRIKRQSRRRWEKAWKT